VLDASDIRCLKPMAEAAKHALELKTFNVVADASTASGTAPTVSHNSILSAVL
jgi:hypothetical protein